MDYNGIIFPSFSVVQCFNMSRPSENFYPRPLVRETKSQTRYGLRMVITSTFLFSFRTQMGLKLGLKKTGEGNFFWFLQKNIFYHFQKPHFHPIKIHQVKREKPRIKNKNSEKMYLWVQWKFEISVGKK